MKTNDYFKHTTTMTQNGTVTMNLRDYNDLITEKHQLLAEIHQMKKNRIEELKRIFQLTPDYSSLELNIKAGEVLKEIYGDRISFGEKIYEKDEHTIVFNHYSAYKEIKNKEE